MCFCTPVAFVSLDLSIANLLHCFISVREVPADDTKTQAATVIMSTGESIVNNNSISEKELQKLLEQLKAKIAADAYLSTRNIDGDFVLKFLRVRDHDVEAAFVLITGYFAMRKDHPELFRLPSEVVDVFQDNVFSISLEKNSTGEVVLLFRPGNWNTTKYDAYHIAAAPVPFLEIAAMDPGIQTAGMLEVLDFSNVTWKQFISMPASLHKLSADLSERAIPIKYKKIHVVNQGRLVDMLWTLMKPFVSEEMKQKLNFHGTDFGKLKEVIDESMLPQELGGTRVDTMPHDAVLIKSLDAKVKDLWTKYAP